MRVRVTLFLAVVLMSTGSPLKPQSQATAKNPLDQLAWMVGGKWTADGDKGPDGKPFHVEMQCRWAENHNALKFTTWFSVGGKLVPVYDGMYVWHPARKKFALFYTDDEGSLTEGDASMSGDHLEQAFQIVGTDGVGHDFRSTIICTGQDSYDWNVQHQKDGAWVVMFALKYKRQPA